MDTLAEDPGHRPAPLIVMVRDDAALAAAIAEQLKRAGHAVCVVDSPAGAASAGAAEQVVAIVVHRSKDASANAPQEVQPHRTDPLAAPLIYIAAQDDFEARLGAQRLGATRFLTQPLDMDRLMLMVDAHLLRMPEAPYRVLLVEDDSARLDQHAASLRAAGMAVEAVDDPLLAHAAAVRWRPECIVLARQMRVLSGEALAAILRADARFTDVPLVYLMEPEAAGRTLPLLEGGGETCLPLAVSVADLKACVILRVRRARSLRRMQEDLRASLRESRLLRLAMDLHNLVCITDAAGVIAYVNDAFCRAGGYRRRELLGQRVPLRPSDEQEERAQALLWQTLAQGEVWQGQLAYRRKDDRAVWVMASVVPAADEGGRPSRYLWVGTDLTRLQALHAQQQSGPPAGQA